MKTTASRETSSSGDGLIAVVMPKEKAPGVRAFGALKPGQVYRVVPAEAVRLVTVKRFEYATAEDRRAGIAFEAAQAAPAATEPTEAAPAADSTVED